MEIPRKYMYMGVQPGGGGTQLFFGEYVPRARVSKNLDPTSRERVFLVKRGVLGAKFRKFCLLRAEILAKNKAENAIFSKS